MVSHSTRDTFCHNYHIFHLPAVFSTRRGDKGPPLTIETVVVVIVISLDSSVTRY